MLGSRTAPRAPRFKDDGFQFGLELALGAAHRGGADVGEVLATVSRIADGDADAWVREWSATAGDAWAAARAAEKGGHRVSALAHYRRAATYYATVIQAIPRSREADRERDLWQRQRRCWDAVVDLMPAPGQRIVIPYEDTPLTGWFFPAPGTHPGERRPLVVMNNGSDGATSSMAHHGGGAAADRGWHWMTFDGPGQQSALFEQGLFFRPDWEAVLTPVADAMLARPDVDPERMAVIGVSQAGFWVPRALAFEHRYAAAVADPGVVDVSASWTRDLPGMMRQQLEHGDRVAFDREMRLAELFDHELTSSLRDRGGPYGVAGGSAFELFRTVLAYRLDGEVAQITTPLLITDPEGEPFWPGQSQELHDRLTGDRALVRFSAREGADGHCEPLAPALREARIFDWLEDRLTGPGGR
ncbi:MAG: prolyl oligopeptidase family serine peptidase [Solirubrobacteraceae bacterium]|nr:prolyl oligopeptidase family serine peptidase [Solirubrobacteraceae bacterium]